ncbi:iron complex transport system substrate-binding protein [Christiangramia gaetbulicola]|uniref:Iron complex transport system substrate-binding protein n=1 Tax=Christiangramia gaetbulicola TaxID=703340 RepID=A0A2T6AHJ8_9FLAO|nr:ABC transporter substrate-binding protein [Christiangramia gaetbulicola]PTX43294.1 iron complex transport system substrate-binding protein [Christiangramia gaetbulicola]
MKKILFIFLILGIFSCKEGSQKNKAESQPGKELEIEDAKGFSITKFDNYSIIKVNTPWPDAQDPFIYLLKEKDAEIHENLKYDQVVEVPVENIVVTSTTHIPALEALHEEKTLKGFPGLNYISSEKTRKLIDNGEISELGQNENINTEVLIELSPDVVIGFAIDASNKSFETIQKTGIPVIYNGDWTEQSPLGKAEWIKFFGALYGKKQKAKEIFNKIKSEYLAAKELAKTAEAKPKVISGSMFNDKWYMPYGNSWQAQILEDANSNYLYSDTQGDGSLSLAFESVLENAEDAEFWMSSGQFTSYEQLFNESEHYKRFKAVKDRNVYSVSLAQGETGGILYYELGPQRPDLILKDHIAIFHPELLKDYELVFYKPLN